MMECEVKAGYEGNGNGNGNGNGDVRVFSDENGLKGEGCDVGEEGVDLGNEILEGLDSYLADIDDRLMISRMVNESVTKGMVNAVEEEASELIAGKELEIESLKKCVLLNEVSNNQSEITVGNGKELDAMSLDGWLSCTDGLREHDKMRESVERLRVVASEHCVRIREELDTVRGCNSMQRTGSGIMLGLGGVLPEKAGDKWDSVYGLLDGLQNTMTFMCNKVSNDLQLSSVSVRERKQQREVRGDIETNGMDSSLTSLQQVSGNAMPCDKPNVNLQKKLDELSVLHKELDSLLKSLKNPEMGHLLSSGSIDHDSSHSKFQGNHVLPPTTFWHGNGKMEDSKINVPEAMDAAQFKHLNREELVNYFNSTMRKMRRDHESIVGKMTDDYFSLKREYLKERSPSLPHWKDNNEVDMVRKKIPQVISKLDKILSESAYIVVSNDKCDFEDSYMEALITHDIYGVLFKEATEDAQQKLRKLYSKYLLENERSISHEKRALEKETRLWQIIEDKERLGQQVLELQSSVQEKEKTARDLSTALANERELFENVSKELNSLREETSHQQTLASECAKKLESASDQLSDAFQNIEQKEVEISKLHQVIQNKTEDLKQMYGQIEVLRELSEQRYSHLLLAEGKSKELEKQMEAVFLNAHLLSNTLGDFEKQVGDSIKTNSLRLNFLSSHLKSVIGEASMLRRSVLVYKDQVDRRTADIQTAEAEVDLLGDEVDVLWGLLEKIYIGLDHYSPVLKHYPGIMEILQLVGRELSGGRPKSV